MKKRTFLKLIASASIIASFLYSFCIKEPNDPFDRNNTSCQLLLKNLSGQSNNTSIEDSIGKPVYIGMWGYLAKYIDSVEMVVTLDSSLLILDTILHFLNPAKTDDTLWDTILFKSAGEYSIKTRALTSFGKVLYDSATVVVYYRVLPNNSPPKWDIDTIRMSVSSGASISINLADTCTDPDHEPVSFSLLAGAPALDTIADGIYQFAPLPSDTGDFLIHIVAADAAQSTDTLTIALTVLPLDSLPPTIKLFDPAKDSISVNASSYKVRIICFDRSKVSSVKCFMGADTFPVERTDSIYSAIATGLKTNVYNPITFIAVDASNRANSARKTIYIKNDPSLQDLTGPILRRSVPNRDSISVAIDSTNIQIIATDQSNVASVICLLGATTMTVKKADSLYSATIKGLVPNEINRVDFIATDASINKNKDTLSFFINYDQSLLDSIRPAMRLNSPKNDSASVGSSTFRVEIAAKDLSGIASVVCSFKAADFTVTRVDSLYSATITGFAANQFNIIRFIATDASSNGNKETLFVAIKYDPAIIDNQKPTMRRIIPAKDSATIGAASTTVSIVVKDTSGIASVACSFGSNTPAVTLRDSVYSAAITGLVANQFNKIRFIAIDASSNGNKETLFVFIKYDPTMTDNQKPTMHRKTPAQDSTTIGSASTTVSIVAKDSSGIASVACSFGDSTPVVTAADSVYSAAITGLVANQINKIRFIATDASSNGNKDTLFISIKYDPTMLDTVKPTMYLRSPAKDSASVGASTFKAEIVVKDGSGIDTVRCLFNNAELKVTVVDSLYSAPVGQLAASQFSRVDFIAIDGSVNKNTDTLTFFIKYDPTITDNVPPIISRVSGPTPGLTVTTPAVTIVYSITDDKSGVDSVYWTLNGARKGYLTESSGQYTLNGSLTLPHNNKIAIYAWDKSISHNRDSITFTLNYNQPPVANSQTTVTTPRATPKSITLTAIDPESDALKNWTIVKNPSNGAVTGAAPAITYTPNTTFEGKDTLTFTVSDSTNTSNAGLVIITVTANNIAPVIQTQPSSVTVNKGLTAAFSITINSDVYPAPSYKWVRNTTDTIAGATAISYTTPATVYADSGNKYRIVVLSGPNKAVSNDATLSVMDVTAPTISLNGGSPVTVSQNGSWTDPGANATDDKDGAITPIRSGTFDITTPGTYTLTYTATDKAGHSNSVQRTVNVVAVWVKKDFKTISNVSRAILKNDVLYFAEASDQELWLQKLGSTGTIIAETSYPGFPYNGLSLAVGSDGTTLFVGSIQVIASWNGSTWTVVDTIMDWNSVGGFAMHIGAGNRPYIASMDNSTFAERVRKFVSAGNWSIVGYDEEIPLGTGGAHDQHFCIVAGGPAVFTIGVDYTTPVISTANLNGNAWNVVNISPGASGDQRTNVQIISSGNSVYAGFALGDGSAPKVFAWSGTSWTNLSYPENSTTGVAGFSIGCSPAPSSVVYAAYIEGTGPINNVVIKKYEGGSWKNVPQTGNGVAFTTDADQIQIVPGTNKCYAVTIKGAAQQLSIWSIDSN